MHELVVAGHMREAGPDGQIPAVRQRQSSLPPLNGMKNKKRSKTSLVFAGLLLTINVQLKEHLVFKLPDYFNIEVYVLV